VFSYVAPSIRQLLIKNHQLVDLDRSGRETSSAGRPFISLLGPVTIPRTIDGEEVLLEWYPFVRRVELTRVLKVAKDVSGGESDVFRTLLQTNMSVN